MALPKQGSVELIAFPPYVYGRRDSPRENPRWVPGARTPTDPQAVLRQIQNIVRSADADMPIYDVRTMEDHMGIALMPARLGGSVLGLFAPVAPELAGLALFEVGAQRHQCPLWVISGHPAEGRITSAIGG